MRKTFTPYWWRNASLLLATFCLLTPFSSNAQSIDYSFDSYIEGDAIGVVDARWSTWSGTTGGPEDAFVDTTRSQSGNNSLIFENAATDAIFLMGNQTTGVWEAGFSLYVASGNSAYYNIQQDETPAVNWMVEMFFNSTGSANITVDQAIVDSFNYSLDQWVDVLHVIDLDNDSIEIYIDGAMVYSNIYTLTAGSSAQLGSFDFYPLGGNGPGTTYHVDDMVLKPTTDPSFDFFFPGDSIAVVDANWDTWDGNPGGQMDAVVSDLQSSSGLNSLELLGGATNPVYVLGGDTAGVFEAGFNVYVPSGNSSYFNIQSGLPPYSTSNSEWKIEVFMDDNANARLDIDGSTYNLSYMQDDWTNIKYLVDLDNDLAQIAINGPVVKMWKYSQNSDGTPGLRQLGGLNFFPDGGNATNKTHYLDDMVFQTGALQVVTDPSFEIFAPGIPIAQSDIRWNTWDDNPGGPMDVFVSSTQANSGTSSIELNGGAEDPVYELDRTTGTWEAGFSIFVPTGSSAYYNIQSGLPPYTSANWEWKFEVFMNDAGNAFALIDGDTVSFNYTQGSFVDVAHIIDLDRDIAQFLVDGNLISQWTYSQNADGTAGLKALGAFNFFPDAGTGTNKTHYIDDMVFQPGTLVGLTSAAPKLEFRMFPNPATNGLTVLNTFNGRSQIIIRDASGKSLMEVESFDKTTNIDISALNAGIYFVELRNGEKRGVQKLIVQ